MNNIRFLRKASQELDEAVEWYNQQSSGLGIKFLDEVDKGLRRISIYPYSCVEIEDNIRRCLVSRFPYGLIYGMDEGMIVIIAVAHLHRRPRYWSRRIGLGKSDIENS
ncbi:MAG: type II toxin-antitoxin system RelE/ParE family toxin [Desulfococcaceae bacterium]|jgi:plasmid stabilization system protein ParE|nr:type II toxin-antitoxin system RelE/ParE family toxin [Desulfococcaceae bacterium]